MMCRPGLAMILPPECLDFKGMHHYSGFLQRFSILSPHEHFCLCPLHAQLDGHQSSPIYQGLLSSDILSRASKRQLSSPIVPGFFSAELFVPSSILLPRLEIPPVLSSQECSTHWPDSSAGSGWPGSFFLTFVRQTATA